MPNESERTDEERAADANVTERGRYGTAPKDAAHMSPEMPPLGIEDVEARPPHTPAGGLPENRGREEEEESGEDGR